MQIIIRKRYDSVPDVKVDFKGEKSLVDPSFEKEADINAIMAKYTKTGELPGVFSSPQYGDFSSVGDYKEALDMVRHAQHSFMSLPSSVRDRFHNDPAKLIEFLSDENNLDEAIELGLANPREPDSTAINVPKEGVDNQKDAVKKDDKNKTPDDKQ